MADSLNEFLLVMGFEPKRNVLKHLFLQKVNRISRQNQIQHSVPSKTRKKLSNAVLKSNRYMKMFPKTVYSVAEDGTLLGGTNIHVILLDQKANLTNKQQKLLAFQRAFNETPLASPASRVVSPRSSLSDSFTSGRAMPARSLGSSLRSTSPASMRSSLRAVNVPSLRWDNHMPALVRDYEKAVMRKNANN